MQLPQDTARMSRTKVLPNVGGLGAWLLDVLRGIRSERQPAMRQMHLLETLPLGGKKTLMLVSCGGERFLVGGGLESVETIVPLKSEASLDVMSRRMDGACL